MPANLQRARELFLHAVGQLPPEGWDDYVAQACGADVELAQHVNHFLQVHREAGSFLEQPAAELGPTGAITSPVTPLEAPGMMIGPYKLLQQIGEGGMGTVFMAEQTHPVQRKVALKVIKAGLDSRQVIARFEAERQALALMDHPNIARVLDAGTIPSPSPPGGEGRGEGYGRPYFVMELVKGVPITKYCDEHHLTLRERLALFVPVCQAVQHAHQKGIIHRDLKASNVMVCLYDGKPVPKVIDFGVAKAAGPQLTDKTLFTEFGQVLGTLEYMSPEQAEINQLDIDTRSDIYSLGVLLYELLTGTTPLERKRFKAVALLEVLRLIREEEPQKPSTRLSATEELPSIAANRRLEPKKLSGLVRGELDWIVMKCLEKERDLRYETANALAMDLEHYLADEPVLAGPPSAWYRFRKFSRRNWKLLAAAGVILFFLTLVGGGIGWWSRDRAVRRQEAEGKTSEALQAAEPLLREGHPWNLALVSAAQRVEAQLDSGLLGPDTQRRADQFHREVRMLTELDEIRLGQAESKDGSMFDSVGTERRYRAAFSSYGLEVSAMEPSEAAARIRDSAIREALVAGLDAWMRLKPLINQDQAWLRAVADGADDSGWRPAMRGAAQARDVPKLRALAGQERALEQSPSGLAFLWMPACGRRLKTSCAMRSSAIRRISGSITISGTCSFCGHRR